MLFDHQVAQLIVTHDLFYLAIIIGHQHLDPLMVSGILVHDLLNDFGSHTLSICCVMQVGEAKQLIRRESR